MADLVSKDELSKQLSSAGYVEKGVLDFRLMPYAKTTTIHDLAGVTGQYDARLLALEKEVLLPCGRLANLERRPGTDGF